MTQAQQYRLSDAAAIIKMSPSSLRNYCRDFAALLSAGASPGPGIERVLTDHDIAILQKCRELRKQGQAIENVIDTLQNEDVNSLQPYIDLAVSTPIEDPANTLQGPQSSDLAIAIMTDINRRFDAVTARIEAQEKASAGKLSMFAIGILTGVALCLFVLLFLWALSITSAM